MGWIINKIRQWFCVHDWELLHQSEVWDADNPLAERPMGVKWTYRCKKCGKVNIVKNY